MRPLAWTVRLYFITGGRGTQSELFRVTYVGAESTDPNDARDTQLCRLARAASKTRAAPAPGEKPDDVVAMLIPQLSTPRPPHSLCGPRRARANAACAVANPRACRRRSRLRDRRSRGPGPHGRFRRPRRALLAALDRLDYRQLTVRQQLDYLRALSLAFIRLGCAEPEVAARLAATFDPYYPATSDPLNRELCELLVFLKSPTVLAKTLALEVAQPAGLAVRAMTRQPHSFLRSSAFGPDVLAMMESPPDPQKIAYAFR